MMIVHQRCLAGTQTRAGEQMAMDHMFKIFRELNWAHILLCFVIHSLPTAYIYCIMLCPCSPSYQLAFSHSVFDSFY